MTTPAKKFAVRVQVHTDFLVVYVDPPLGPELNLLVWPGLGSDELQAVWRLRRGVHLRHVEVASA